MGLITSNTYYEEKRMTARIATEDIVQRNSAGQNVVVVAKGDVVPEGVEIPKSKSVAAAAEEAAVLARKSSTRQRKA